MDLLKNEICNSQVINIMWVPFQDATLWLTWECSQVITIFWWLTQLGHQVVSWKDSPAKRLTLHVKVCLHYHTHWINVIFSECYKDYHCCKSVVYLVKRHLSFSPCWIGSMYATFQIKVFWWFLSYINILLMLKADPFILVSYSSLWSASSTPTISLDHELLSTHFSGITVCSSSSNSS